MPFGISFLLLFALASLSARAGDLSCKNSLTPDQASGFDAYATFLRYHPTQTKSSVLFEESLLDASLRSTLNEKISTNIDLSEASSAGLHFHSWVSTFTQKELTHVEPAREAFTPWQNLETDYQVFLQSLNSKQERPMSDAEAERKAHSDISIRFGIDPGSSSAAFAQSPEIRFYFQRRKNYYLNQEVPNRALHPGKQEERFRAWLNKKIENLELERAENLKALIFETTRTTHRRVFFEVASTGGGNPFWTRTLTLEFLESVKPSISSTLPGEFTLEIKPDHLGFRQDQSFFQKVFDSDLWYTPFSKSYAPAIEEMDSTSHSALVFTLAPGARQEIEPALRSIRAAPASVQEIRIPIPDLLQFMQKNTSKSDYPGALLASTKIHARIEYETRLHEKIKELRALGSNVTMTGFSRWTANRSATERSFFQNPTVSKGILTRFQDLNRPTLHDPLTGLEWFGYAIHPDYWNQRDLAGSRSHTGFPSSWVGDFWDKSKNITRRTIVLGSLVSMIWGGVEIAERSGVGAPRSSPKSVVIGTSDEAHDSFGTDQDANGDGVPDTLFTVKAERINRKTLGPLYLPVESVPRYFDHATAADARDPAKLIDVTETIPHEIINLHAFDTISRQTLIVDTKVLQVPVDSFLFLPLPEGYDLVFYDSYLEDSLRIYRNRQTGMYLLKILKSPADRFFFRAGYVKTAMIEPEPELVLRLSDLDRNRITEMNGKINSAGLHGLSRDLSKLLETPGPISARAIADLIKNGQRYSLKPGKGPKWIHRFSANPYSKFTRYLGENGLLHFKCDIANELLQTMLREILGDDSTLIIKPLHSFVYEKNKNPSKREFESGFIGGIGHARTQIMIAGNQGKIVLDATPITQSDDSRSGTEPEPVQMQEEIRNSSPNESDTRKPQGILPDPVRPIRDLKSLIARRRLILIHQERMAQLEELAEQLLNGPSFRSWIKKNPREYLPPQRVYILARRVLEYGSGQVTLEELNHVLRDTLFIQAIESSPDPEGLQTALRKIGDAERLTWDQCRQYQEKTRKFEFLWAQDYPLRSQVDRILDLLASHSWSPGIP